MNREDNKRGLINIKMVEKQKQRVEQEMSKMMDDLDQQFLRKMQADMHRCAARCCDNMDMSLERVQQCVDKCSTPLTKAQSYVRQEIEHLQNRLQRCVMECNDEIRDKVGVNPNQSEIDKFSTIFENCAIKCVDKNIELIPSVSNAIKTVLLKQSSTTI